jgi:hypothetical protein
MEDHTDAEEWKDVEETDITFKNIKGLPIAISIPMSIVEVFPDIDINELIHMTPLKIKGLKCKVATLENRNDIARNKLREKLAKRKS